MHVNYIFFFRILWESQLLMQNPQWVVCKIPALTNISIKSYQNHHIYNVHWIGKVVYFQKLCRCFGVFFNFKGSTKDVTVGFVYPTSVTQCTLCIPRLLHNTLCVCHFAPQGTAHRSLVSAPFRDPVPSPLFFNLSSRPVLLPLMIQADLPTHKKPFQEPRAYKHFSENVSILSGMHHITMQLNFSF